MATNIKITDTRYGESFRTGINGILYDIPVNTEVKVEDALAEHIRGLGVAFEEPRERSSKGASGSEEGSGDVLAPVSLGFGGSSTVEAPAMRPKSVGSGSGTQPGDVTSAGGGGEEEEAEAKGAEQQDIIAQHSAISDVRVQGERRSDRLASVAEIAGEGEQGETPAGGAAASGAASTASTAERRQSKSPFKPHK